MKNNNLPGKGNQTFEIEIKKEWRGENSDLLKGKVWNISIDWDELPETVVWNYTAPIKINNPDEYVASLIGQQINVNDIPHYIHSIEKFATAYIRKGDPLNIHLKKIKFGNNEK